MRIGSRSSTPRTQEYSRATASPEDFGAGVGAALRGLGGALIASGETEIDLLNAARAREEARRNTRLDLEFTRWQGNETRLNQDRRVNVQPGAEGHTNSVYEAVGASFDEFATASGMTPEERERYELRFETFRQNTATTEYAFEIEESINYTTTGIAETVDSVLSEIVQDPSIYQERWDFLRQTIEDSELPPTIREEVLANAENALASQLYTTLTEQALQDQAPVGVEDGSNVVAPGTSALGRGLLNTYSGSLANPALPITGDHQGVQPNLISTIQQAWGYIMPPGSRIVVTSGFRSIEERNHNGRAADFAVYRPDGSRVMWNDPEALRAAQVGRVLGIEGFGAGPFYMSGNTFHWDVTGRRLWNDSGEGQINDQGGAADWAEALAEAEALGLEGLFGPGGFPAAARGTPGDALLGTIHSVESGYGNANPYNVMFGGDTFDSYADHPRQTRVDPRTGNRTSAAGRYQFLESTWDFVREQMEAEGYDFGNQPFSPVNQDRAALWYAEHRYGLEARRLGLPLELADLNTALQSGNPEAFATVRWVLSGESGGGVAWEGLQNMTNEQFYETMQRNMSQGPTGTVDRPDVWSDPRFANLPFEERMRLDQVGAEAEISRRQQLAQARADQEAAIMAQVRTLAAAGQNDQAEMTGLDAMNNGLISDIGNIERILGYGAQRREEEGMSEEQQVRRGQGIVATPDDMNALNAEAQVSGVSTGIREMAPEAAQRLLQNVQVDGMVPSSIMDTLFSQFNSGQGQQQTFAAELLADLFAVNPRAATAGLNNSQISDVALANVLARTSATPAEFIDRINQMRAPENAQMRQMRMEEADTILEEQGLPNFYRSMYGQMERWFSAEPPSVGQLPRFEADARTLYREFYALTGDANMAQQATADVLRHSYTPSPMDNTIMEFSPTAPMMNVPAVGGTHAWIPEYVEDFARGEIDMAIDREVAAAVASGMSEEEARPLIEQDYGSRFDVADMRILSDTQTLTDLQNTGIPSYAIVYTDQFGMVRQLRDGDNNIMRIPMSPPEQVVQAARDAAMFTHAQELANRARLGPFRQVGQLVIAGAQAPFMPVDAMRRGSEAIGAAAIAATNYASNLAEAEAVSDQRVYEGLIERPDIDLIGMRNSIIRRAQNPDPMGEQTPAQMMQEPTPVEQRIIAAINRILNERANQ